MSNNNFYVPQVNVKLLMTYDEQSAVVPQPFHGWRARRAPWVLRAVVNMETLYKIPYKLP